MWLTSSRGGRTLNLSSHGLAHPAHLCAQRHRHHWRCRRCRLRLRRRVCGARALGGNLRRERSGTCRHGHPPKARGRTRTYLWHDDRCFIGGERRKTRRIRQGEPRYCPLLDQQCRHQRWASCLLISPNQDDRGRCQRQPDRRPPLHLRGAQAHAGPARRRVAHFQHRWVRREGRRYPWLRCVWRHEARVATADRLSCQGTRGGRRGL
mmetsp:Transcript_3865/g.4511  ORF Transcript_3865/g.4511 Transcript_3865/m.4511 type:complete len:208 (+) Transcript_3865:123-746(+)